VNGFKLYYSEIIAGMAQVSATAAEPMKQTPAGVDRHTF
jgi:hypothetical protein